MVRNVCKTMYEKVKQRAKVRQQKVQHSLEIASHGFTNGEKAQCVLWTAEGQGLPGI